MRRSLLTDRAVRDFWQPYLLTGTEKYNVPTTIIRNGHILGDGGLLKTLLPYYRWGVGGPLGSGEQWFPWIHMNDIARIYVAALHQADNVDTVNAVSNNRVRNREFSQTLAQVLSRPHIFRIPQFTLRMLFGDFAEEMLYSQRIISKAEEKLGITLQFDQLKKALHDLLGKVSHN
ncbi:MAG: hypothetical protein BRC25_00880 [Parcubacteria group bacterium SW_6_46_9]|nr:MAG: hypothetical protein BRC25_00880 [Parcubacteria group bacterium SW_6_46_9]